MKITRDSKLSELQDHGFTKNLTVESEFVDAQEMHKAHHKTFGIPSDSDLAEITPSAHAVKLSTGDERFWVIVQTRDENNFTGIINNDLVCHDAHGLCCGDTVRFETRHIYSVCDM